MLSRLLNIFRVPELRNKLGLTLLFLVVYRIGIWLPVPGVSFETIDLIVQSHRKTGGSENKILNLLDMFSGGNISNVALFGLGIMPYISASIISQLLVKIVPAWDQLQKEGQRGRDIINKWTRVGTIFLCVIQSYMIIKTIVYRPVPIEGGSVMLVPESMQGFKFEMIAILSWTAGTMFLLWLGEQITKFGMGHGVSLIIMLGIIARLPQTVMYMISEENRPIIPLVLLVLYVVVVAAIILITQGQRKIPVQYAQHMRGRKVYGTTQRTFFPIRVNMAGVMPVIFASSLLIFPSMVMSLFGAGENRTLGFISGIFNPPSWTWLTLYIALVFFFSYFWNALMFNPTEQADNMKKMGAFIPGFTPGTKTAEFFEKIMNRMTFAGAGFLAAIAVFPTVIGMVFRVDAVHTQFLGGTGLLIVAGVALDMVSKIESQLVMRNYDGFLGGGTIRGRR